MAGAGGGFAGAIGGEATVGAATSRETAGGLGNGFGAWKPVPAPEKRASAPAYRYHFRYAYRTQWYSTRAAYLARNFSIRGARNEPLGFLVSPRPVSRCAICRNISVVR